jgi:hypothetical protein
VSVSERLFREREVVFEVLKEVQLMNMELRGGNPIPSIIALKRIFLKEYIMKQNDTTLHLWFKPYNGIMTEADVSFVERYSKRFYPRAMSSLARELHRLVADITRYFPAEMFAYQMSHFTVNANGRYILEESLRDASHDDGLCIGIQATTAEERRVFDAAFGQDGATLEEKTQSVHGVIAYLEDSLKMESHKWENAKLHNGGEAIWVVKQLVGFLNSIKTLVRVYEFSLTESEDGMRMTMVLVSPGVKAYYTRLDWAIV